MNPSGTKREDADYLCDDKGFPLGDIGAGDALAIIEDMPATPPEAFAAGWNAARRKAFSTLSVPTPGTGGADKWLGELLAIIHRYGGQYQAMHGLEKAVEDAHSILAAAFSTPQAGDLGAVKVKTIEWIRRPIAGGEDRIMSFDGYYWLSPVSGGFMVIGEKLTELGRIAIASEAGK